MTSSARPLYLVVDVSFSTTDRFGNSSGIEQTNGFVDALLDRLSASGSAGEVWMSVIDFADEARLQVPLARVDRLLGSRPPPLVARGGTSYARAFELTAERLASDVAQLRADGAEVAPPLLVFLTDGDPVEPDRAWQHAFATLISLGPGITPHVWPVGYGDANPMLLDRLVSPPGWVAHHLLGPGDGVVHLPQMVLDALSVVDARRRHERGEGRAPFAAPDPDDLDWRALAPAPPTTSRSDLPESEDS